MLDQSKYAYLIEITQKLVNNVSAMTAGYKRFPDLIEIEHQMIKSHTYTDQLEAAMKAKTEASEAIAASFEELQQLAQQVYMIWSEMDCEGQASFPGDLANCVTMLWGIFRKISDSSVSGLQDAVLKAQIEKLSSKHDEFRAVAAVVKPMIEVNRVAITQVAQNYQMSTKILFEMAEQLQSTYTAQGQQAKAVLPSSTISIKA